jgi:RNA polymerase sigma-70 factor (ECF subfamily)
MSEENAFRDLVRRVRSGDEQAAAELVRRYESTIRLVVRRRLTDPRMRRLFDSMDICQSVMGTFFAGAAAGQFELDTPEHLLKLLATMARNKLTSHARKQQAARRRPPRSSSSRSSDAQQVVDPSPGPSQIVAAEELQQEILRKLSPEERRIADLRADGRSWEEIAAQLGSSAAAVRMQLNRAIERIKRQLGWE